MRDVSHQRGTNPPTRDVNAAQRVSLAVKLRAAKLTYEAIAAQCGYATASACRKAILREMDRCVVKNVEELRTQELHMLDTLHTECWKLVMDRENDARLPAVDRVLAISKARRELLGLNIAKDGNLIAAQVIVREAPPGYLGEPKS